MIYSLLKHRRSSFLGRLADGLDIEGAFVELGTWRGGSAAKFIQYLKPKDRDCWLFDSFEGLPEPSEYDTVGEKHASEYENFGMPDDDADTYEICKEFIGRLDYPKEKIHIIKGWFEDTFPKQKDSIGKIAVLHVDCDFYESVKYSLETFYDKVVEGGTIIFDDYHHWKGAKKAVDEFFKERKIKPYIKSIDSAGAFLIKENIGDVKMKTITELVIEARQYKIAQHGAEIVPFCEVIKEEAPTNFLEVGTKWGGTFFLWCQFCDGLKISVDLPGAGWGGKRIKGSRVEVREDRLHSFADDVHVLNMDSHSEETVDAAKKILGRKKLGFLFIDGDHTYAGVKQDYEMFSPLVRKGGIIGFHDMAKKAKHVRAGVEVSKLWDEIDVPNKQEIICTASWGGIGWFRKP